MKWVGHNFPSEWKQKLKAIVPRRSSRGVRSQLSGCSFCISLCHRMGTNAAMAIVRDYLEPTETHQQTETKFIDQLLEGWGKWSRETGIDQRAPAAGDLWQIQSIVEVGTYVLKVMDDWFMLTDQSVAKLPFRLKQIVVIEYIEPGAARTKADNMGLAYIHYRQRLHAAQWTMFASLEPWITQIKRNADVTAIKNAARFRSKPIA